MLKQWTATDHASNALKRGRLPKSTYLARLFGSDHSTGASIRGQLRTSQHHYTDLVCILSCSALLVATEGRTQVAA